MKFKGFNIFAYIAFFLCCICSPLVFTNFNLTFSKINENRILAPKPELTLNYKKLKKYPRKYTAYYNDNFCFRNFLIALNSFIRVNILNISPNPKVILGSKGWFYFAGENEAFNSYQDTLNSAELNSFCSNMINRKNWLKNHGIHYYAMIVPDKQSIYYEYLQEPQKSWIHNSKFEQVINCLTNKFHDNIFIDIKSKILAIKNKGHKVYYQTDTHWNSLGAFIAYSELLKTINIDFPNAFQITRSDLVESARDYCGDLANIFLNLPIKEKDTLYKYKKSFNAIMNTFEKNYDTLKLSFPLVISTNSNVSTGTVIVIRDSQFIPILNWFAESFSKVLFINYWEKNETVLELITSEKPGIIVDERVERNLLSHNLMIKLKN